MMSWPSQSESSSSGQTGERPNGASVCLDELDAWACGDDSPSRRDALELAALEMFGEKRGGLNLWLKVGELESQVDVFWRAAKIPGSILRPQNPLSYPSQKITAQKDVTAETALKSVLKKRQ